MRILHTCATYWPLVDGVSIAMQRISEGLAARGHDVTVATGWTEGDAPRSHNGVTIERFAVAGNDVDGCTGDVDAYTAFVSTFPCDIILDYAAQIWASDLVFPLLPTLTCKKVFVPCGYSALGDPRYARYFAEMPAHLALYDRVVYLSDGYQDRRFGQEHGAGGGVVIGNGAAVEEFGTLRSGFRDAYGITARTLLICVANLMDDKGQREVLEAFEASGIADAALVFIAGEINRYGSGALRTSPGPAYDVRRKANIARYELVESRRSGARIRLALPSRPGTTATVLAGVPRELVIAAYAEADIFLFASKVECAPLVIYEAMASGTPFISTRVGNVADLPGGIVVDSPAEMAEEIGRLSVDSAEWRRLADAGRESWRREHTWEHVVDRYERLYAEVLGGD